MHFVKNMKRGKMLIMKYLLLLKFLIKAIFNLPVYRKDVLERTKIFHNNYYGLCEGLRENLSYFNIPYIHYVNICVYIPKFKTNVEFFNGNSLSDYWWRSKDWTTGRLDYLNWLIDVYKDDKTNLRKL